MENNKKNSAVEKVEILSAQTENSGDLSNHGVEVNEPATVQNPVKRTKTTKRTRSNFIVLQLSFNKHKRISTGRRRRSRR